MHKIRRLLRLRKSHAGVLIFSCVLYLFVFSDAGRTQELDEKAGKYFKKAMNAPDLTQRIKYLEKALQIEPLFKEAVFELGKSYYQKGVYEQSIARLTQTIRLDSSSYQAALPYLRNAYVFLAKELNENEHYHLAQAKAQQALQIDENYAPALTLLGGIYFNLEEFDHAFQALEQSLAINPNQEIAWSKLGDLYLHSKEYDKAVHAYEQALKIDPEFEEAQFQLQLAEQKNQPDSWLERANVSLKKDELKSALEVLQRAHRLYPDDHAISGKLDSLMQEQNYLAGLLALENREWTAAFEIFQKVDPEYKQTTLKLEEARAELILNKAGSLLPGNVHKTTRVDSLTNQGGQNTEQVNRPSDLKKVGSDLDESVSQNSKKSAKLDSTAKVATAEEGVNSPSETPAKQSHPAADSRNSPGAAQSRDFLVPSEVIEAPKIITLPEVVGMIGGILVLGFLFIKFKNSLRISAQHEVHSHLIFSEGGFVRTFARKARLSTRTINFFKEKLTSDTPVVFNTNEAGTIFKESDGADKKRVIDAPEPNLLTAQETKTILGGVKKVRRIGRYVIEKEIARGPMGQVFKAWDPKLDRTVVIKQVAFDFGVNSVEYTALKDRLYREAHAAGKLNHPNIVVIYDVDEENGFCFIVMEYLEGEDLRVRLEREGKLELNSVIRIASQVCSALDYAHHNDIVHRDIKPSNIIITKQDRVKVADFGIAKLPKLGTLTLTGNVLGTPFYMSPEQIEGRYVDGRSDVFSLGVVLYEMLTGVRPFDSDTVPSLVYKIVHQIPKPPSMVDENVPSSVDKIIERALAKDPGKRFASVVSLLEALEKLQGKCAER